MAHRATCSTPTECGRTSSRESTWTRGRAAEGSSAPSAGVAGPTGEQAPNSRERWGARMRSTRAHSAGPVPARQGDEAAEVAQGALAHLGAAADEAVGEVGLLARGRVGVWRTNRLRWEQALGRESGNGKLLGHYIEGFRRLAIEN